MSGRYYNSNHIQGNDAFRPEFYRADDMHALTELRKVHSGLRTYDVLNDQLKELVKSLNPSVKFTPEELAEEVIGHLNGTAIENYGVWVWYPWNERLVHMLDEEEFIRVRTDRNRNKITTAEQDLLRTKKVGIVGLSVGREVCMTLAQERCCGEIRLADHDQLDLSNLNRLRSNVFDLGMNKAVLAARNVAELDPFLKVSVFSEGLNRGNLDAFFNEGGKLDLLIEECDSVDVKIFCRQKAKELGVPVIMDTSDKGMLDIERFDLEPDRSILHGLIDHLDPADAAKAKTNEEKVPFVLPIIGLDTMTKRMKASMLEIENSVSTWPQLASAVALGGAVTTDVSRRILLGQHQQSGRWFVDLGQLVGGEPFDFSKQSDSSETSDAHSSGLTTSSMRKAAEDLNLPDPVIDLNDEQARSLVDSAVLAPSAGNMQPWKFLLHNGQLLVFNDPELGRSQLDSGQLLPRLDTGTAIESMLLKANSLSLELSVKVIDHQAHGNLIAVLSCTAANTIKEDPLLRLLDKRCTNRRKTKAEQIQADVLDALSDATSKIDGANVDFITDRDDIHEVARLVGAAERIRVLNPIGHEELLGKEIRWTQQEVESTRDGLDVKTFELNLSEEAGMAVAADPAAIALLHEWKAGSGFTKLSGDGIRTASAVALVSMPSNSTEHGVNAGRAVQRLWLSATQHALAVHPISAPILLSHHVLHGSGEYFSEEEKKAVADLGDQTRELFKLNGREPMFIVRLGKADAPSMRSLRRPTEHFYQTELQITV